MAPRLQFNAKSIIEQGRVPQEAFDEVKEWCKTENLQTLSDEQLILFLLSCYNKLDLTKNTIRMYFKCKLDAPELFDNRKIDAEDVIKAKKTSEYAMLPVRNAKNESIIVWRLLETSYYKLHIEATMKLLLMVGELTLYQDPPDGLVVVLDLKGVGLLHLTRLRLGALRKFFHYVQEGVPCRLKQIHVLNTVYFIDKIMKIMRPFMKEELYKMIRFHPPNMRMEHFFEHHIPIECFPEDYGGTLPKMKILSDETYEAIGKLEKFYRDEEQQYKTYKMTS